MLTGCSACVCVSSDAMSWDILLVTVPTAAEVVEVAVDVEVVEAPTCVATRAMRLDTCHVTVQLRRSHWLVVVCVVQPGGD